MKREKRALAVYLILVLVLSAPIEAIWIIYGDAAAALATVLMLVPMIVTFIVKPIYYKKEKVLGFGFGKPIYYLFAVMLPLDYIGISYLLYWLFSPGSYLGPVVLHEMMADVSGSQQNSLVVLLIVSVVSILINIPFTFGEEIGWRGLMYPAMDKLWGRNKALLISGLVWAAWHLPLLIGGVYMAGAPLLYQLPMFIVQVLALTVIFTWVRVKSGSVWPAVLMHSIHNFLDQTIFTTLTGGEKRAYFVSETGLITTLCAWLFAALILIFGKFDRTEPDRILASGDET